MSNPPRILVLAAASQLGRLVLDELLARVPASRLVAAARNPGALAAYAARGVETRAADYTSPTTLDAAFHGIDRALLISSNDLGARFPQHRNAIEAAARAKLGLLAYTSVLHADTSTLGLAEEHRQTEALLRSSGVPWVLLRNGWYTENYTMGVGPAVEHGALLGGAGQGRIASAARADFAAAAAAVLASDEDQAGRVFELAGDAAYTLAEFASELGRQAGREVAYVDLPEAVYRAKLEGFGLPAPLAALIADSDAQAAQGALFDEGRALSRLIGRPTTPLAASIAAALRGA